MKKVLIAFIALFGTTTGFNAMAQADVKSSKDDKKETQEIVIRKKGDKDANITIQINGDKVIVNGKPLVEFKDDAITINKRNIIVRDGDRMVLGEGLMELENSLGNLSWDDDDFNNSGAFLGVTTEKDEKGAKINEITEESAAAKAGLKEDDIITKIGDTKIDGPESLSKAITAKKPKDEVKISYLRDGKERSVKVTLQERKHTANVFSYSQPDGSFKTLTIPQVRAYKDKLRSEGNAYSYNLKTPMAPQLYNGDGYGYSFPRQKKLGLKIQDTEDGTGVKVLEVADSSAAATAGVKKDDIITEIGGEKVNNTDEVRDQLQENSEKSSYNIKARRNGSEMSFDIKIPKKLKTANL
ncbi:MAG: PDZ domain-containing protein [Ferruginibacter sp.]